MASHVGGPEARYKWREGKNGATTREGVLRSVKAKRHPVRFNSGPTKRHAVLDFMALCAEFPEAWERL
jgi:hypothetical protein